MRKTFKKGDVVTPIFDITYRYYTIKIGEKYIVEDLYDEGFWNSNGICIKGEMERANNFILFEEFEQKNQ